MKSKRLTKNIRKYQSFCNFEVKAATFKYLFDFTSYADVEAYVDSELSIAIDKLGDYEDLEAKYDANIDDIKKILEAFKVIKEKKVNVEDFINYEFTDYNDYLRSPLSQERVSTIMLTFIEFNLLKELL